MLLVQRRQDLAHALNLAPGSAAKLELSIPARSQLTPTRAVQKPDVGGLGDPADPMVRVPAGGRILNVVSEVAAKGLLRLS